MIRSMLTSVLFLTGCADRDTVVPLELTRPVVVKCPAGYTSGALGACLLMLREGLNMANTKLEKIGELLD